MTVRVNEIFETIQGEGYFTGTPAIFIRLQGCPVGCPWCDTKHTWEANGDKKVNAAEMDSSPEAWAYMSPEEVLDYCKNYSARHVVITGGEPCADPGLASLVNELQAKDGYRVSIETSGTFSYAGSGWITLSPKLNMPGGLSVQQDIFSRANEIKMCVGKQADIENLRLILNTERITTENIFIQPISESGKATKLCVDAAIVNGWRLSLQTHKMVGLR